MKKVRNMGPVLSLFALLAKSSISRILAVAAVMALAEGALFRGQIRSEAIISFEGAINSSHISAIFLAALGVIFLILARTEGLMGDRSRSTLMRLRLSGTSIFLIKAVWNLLCLALLFIVQIWLVIGMAEVHARISDPGYDLPWMLFLAFYRVRFLHCLLPLAETGKWVCNILLLLAFSVAAAGGIGKKNFVTLALLFILATCWFTNLFGRGLADAACCVLYAAGIGVGVWTMRKSLAADQ
ncbi:MAG: hypothetical protein K2N94_02915 [Lachnospiraceae bacterium]|nr:hypothetical protein [Lachnospiraceae bacterium]